ncbi:hypothetical protein GCM10011511_49530 [Puia dinghuensis]|uniref:Uncharacterized protein n=2 Tax=Puia dinghuensis TaxID=1792502 RepID=A0A8J2XVZ8_9BACT|nr:hypothetical protein GCM10011511_49530 [Puia dinghuensis]
MVNDGAIKSLNEIFNHIPKSTVAADCGKKVTRFTFLMENVEEFKMRELFKIGALCDLTVSQTLELAKEQYLKNNSEKLKP